MINGIPAGIAAKMERERQEDIQHARAMINAYRASGNGEFLKAWENILERLEKRGHENAHLEG